MKLTITHIEGSKKGSKQDLDLPITIGRDPASSIAFDPVKDDRVSTKHAQIAEQGGQVMITDLGSRNGTFVNSQKVMGSAPLVPGALVQFGDGGPMVTIHFDAPAPAAAPPPPKKSGGGGAACAVIAILGLLAVGAVAVVLYLFVFRKAGPGQGAGDHEPRPLETAVASSPAATSAPVAAASPTPVAASPTPAPAASPSPAAVQRYESPWAKVGVGSVFEQESNMHMEKPAVMDMKSTIRYTLASVANDEATIKMETIMPNVPVTPVEMKQKLHDEAATTNETKKLDEKDESVTVPAGTFSCHYVKIESTTSGVKSVSESWMAKDLPVPVKVVVTSSGDSTSSTVTQVLTKVDKK